LVLAGINVLPWMAAIAAGLVGVHRNTAIRFFHKSREKYADEWLKQCVNG